MAIDLTSLWDFSKPDVSEQRFRQALASAEGDDGLILQTQIARTYGLRKDFETARAILRKIESAMVSAGPEAKVRYQLELGRSLASATHKPGEIKPEAKARARQHYEEALRVAKGEKLDALAIDAIHMFAFLDTSPTDQLKWAHAALEVVEASTQADAKRWAASVRNNIGYALHQLGRYDEALLEFQFAVRLRERGHNLEATRVAHWMVAWTLRSLKRVDEALEIQLRLERENDAAGKPDRHVFEELEFLYRAKGDVSRAADYAKRLSSVSKP